MNPTGRRYAGPRVRHLYIVPNRTVSRRPYVPVGRTLHLVDIENLMGGPLRGREAVSEALADYAGVAGLADNDHVVIATNPALLLDASLEWPRSARFLAGHGPNGADLALLREVRDPEWVAERFDRVVIGSGDGIFTGVTEELRQRGVAVGVVAREGGASRRLLAVSTYQRLLPSLDHEWEAA